MADLLRELRGACGVLTLNRPEALNALTHDMCLGIEAALNDWETDPAVSMVMIRAEGAKAFCAGGDLTRLYQTGTAGDYAPGRQFWRDEYRLNARLAAYPKPIASFLQGFTMGGGVGVGCHVPWRVVCDSSRIAMPETGIGLVPDVGGSMLLARAPGRLGLYLGLTAARMGPGDAIHAGFASHYVPEADWPALQEALEAGDPAAIAAAAQPAPDSPMAAQQALIDRLFAAPDAAGIARTLAASDDPLAAEARKAMARHSPLAMATAARMHEMLGPQATMKQALELEYRVTSRSMEYGDFLEGVRALIIDKDKSPRWRHGSLADVPRSSVEALLAPLPAA